MRKSKIILKVRCIKFIFRTVILFTFLFAFFHSAFAQYDLIYYLEIDEKNWDSFIVNITVKNNKYQQLFCGFPNLYPWCFKQYLSGTDVSEFEVSNDYEEKLLFNRINSSSWLVNTKENDVIIISYRINNKRDDILGERIGRNFARVDGGTVFMYIREFKQLPIHLIVRVPHGWKLATGLRSSNQIFEYYAENYRQLIKNPLYMAPFNEVFFNIGDRTGYLIIDGKYNFDIGKLGAMTSKIVTSQIRLFKDLPFDQYLFIFKAFHGPRETISKAYENTSIVYFSYQTARENLLAIAREVANNFFQVWNGNRFYPVFMAGDAVNQIHCSANLWFCHGLSDYYGALTMAKAGLWTEEDFFTYHIDLINRLLRYSDNQMPSVATLSSQILKYDNEKTLTYLRLKGHLLNLLLDLSIRDLTENAKSLDDVIYFMNKWFGDEKIGYGENDILRTICAVTSANLTSFFDLYINGIMELPFSEILKTVGVSIESKTDTLPYLGEISISEHDNIVTKIYDKGPLEIAGLKIGDKLLFLNNQKVYYPQQLVQIIDSLTIGQEVEISIQREGVPLMLLAKVAGKSCNVFSLVSLEATDERQQMIRRSWLSKQLP